MEKLKDIKALVDVPDYSLVIFIAILVTVLTLLVGIYLWAKKDKRRVRRKLTPKEIALQKLKEIDFNDTKESVYTFSENMQILVDEQKINDLNNFLETLRCYQYKKSVPTLSEIDKKKMKEWIEEEING